MHLGDPLDACEIFEYCCLNNRRQQLLLAQWLYNIAKKHIYLNCDFQNIFTNVCEKGHFDTMMWIHSLDNIDNDDTYRDALDNSFANGHLELVLYLYNIIPNMCITTFAMQMANSVIYPGISSQSIIHCCINGHTKMIKWLSSITNDNLPLDTCFLEACKYKRINLAKWLASNFYQYNISFDKHEKFTYWISY